MCRDNGCPLSDDPSRRSIIGRTGTSGGYIRKVSRSALIAGLMKSGPEEGASAPGNRSS
jgi:hypothetical protein